MCGHGPGQVTRRRHQVDHHQVDHGIRPRRRNLRQQRALVVLARAHRRPSHHLARLAADMPIQRMLGRMIPLGRLADDEAVVDGVRRRVRVAVEPKRHQLHRQQVLAHRGIRLQLPTRPLPLLPTRQVHHNPHRRRDLQQQQPTIYHRIAES